MGSLLYRKGENLLLAYPSDKSLRGYEVEVLGISDISNKEYDVLVLATSEHMKVIERQLKQLDDGRAILDWETVPSWLYRYKADSPDD